MIWERIGDVPNWVEPFAGSLAVLLARPHAPKIETCNDIDAHLSNFWRTLAAIGQGNAQALSDVCAVADWPVNETDLHSRHRHLVARIPEVRALIDGDPAAFDATLAGYWVHGICAWIGSGWCTENPREYQANKGKRPAIGGDDGHGPRFGNGIHAAAMREPSRQLPDLGGAGFGTGNGQGSLGRGTMALGNRSRLPEVFAALGQRLRYVRVACGDWRRVLTDSVTWRHGTTGILLDPPYTHDGRAGGLYSGGDSKDIAAEVQAWAIEHGSDKRLRICLCRYDDGAPVPKGWAEHAWKAKGGYGGQSDGENVNAHRERLWFSPGCLTARQASLFA